MIAISAADDFEELGERFERIKKRDRHPPAAAWRDGLSERVRCKYRRWHEQRGFANRLREAFR